jgi:hypothetical protein
MLSKQKNMPLFPKPALAFKVSCTFHDGALQWADLLTGIRAGYRTCGNGACCA